MAVTSEPILNGLQSELDATILSCVNCLAAVTSSIHALDEHGNSVVHAGECTSSPVCIVPRMLAR